MLFNQFTSDYLEYCRLSCCYYVGNKRPLLKVLLQVNIQYKGTLLEVKQKKKIVFYVSYIDCQPYYDCIFFTEICSIINIPLLPNGESEAKYWRRKKIEKSKHRGASREGDGGHFVFIRRSPCLVTNSNMINRQTLQYKVISVFTYIFCFCLI